MKSIFAHLSFGKTPDLKLNLSKVIGSTIARQIISNAFYFIAIWIVTRQLGPHGNGVLTTVMLLPQTLYALLNFGLGASHIYFLSKGDGNHSRMRQMNWILAATLWAAVLIFIITSSEASIATYLPGIKKNVALYASILLPLMLLGSWSSSLLQGNRDYDSYNKTVLIQPVTFCLTIIFLYFRNNVTVISVLSSYLLSNLMLWLLSEVKINKITSSSKNENSFLESITFGLLAHLCNVITFLNYRIDLYLVSYMLNPAETGQYALSIMLAERFWLISGAASMIVFPESSAHRDNNQELNKMVNKIAGVVLKITLTGAMIAVALSPYGIPWIFGSAYTGAVLPFIILLPGIVIWSYMSIISNSLAGLGYLNINFVSSLICLSINIIGNIFAIPKYGTNGAALASTIAYVVAAFYTIVMYKKIMVKRSKNQNLIHAISLKFNEKQKDLK